MSLVSTIVGGELFTHGGYPEYRYGFNKRLIFNHEDTYMAVFSIDQKEFLELFRKLTQFKILYESPKAVNTNMSSGNRNVLVIFELNE